jgi:hypothetical protein
MIRGTKTESTHWVVIKILRQHLPVTRLAFRRQQLPENPSGTFRKQL